MKSLLLIGLTTICFGSTSMARSQAQTNIPAPTTPPTEISLPLVKAAPLVRAVSKLLGQQSYQLESEIELTTVDAPLAAQAYVKTIVAAPNKVHAEITFFDEERALEKQYRIVADGTQALIYDVEANQYSVSEYKQFLKSPTSLAVGALAHFYLSTLNTVNNNRIASRAIAKLPPERLVKYFQRYANIDLENMVVSDEQIKGKTYTVYDLDAADRSYKLTTYVSPQLGNIERVNLVGQPDGAEILMSEWVISQTIPEAIVEATFKFIPPDDAKQVESQIEINPFKNQ